MPDALAGAAAVAHPLCRQALTAGALCLATHAPHWAPCAAACSCIIFGAAMGINIGRGRTAIDCGCFGSRLREGIVALDGGAQWGPRAVRAAACCCPSTTRELSALEIAMSRGPDRRRSPFCIRCSAVVFQPQPPTFDENHGAAGVEAPITSMQAALPYIVVLQLIHHAGAGGAALRPGASGGRSARARGPDGCDEQRSGARGGRDGARPCRSRRSAAIGSPSAARVRAQRSRLLLFVSPTCPVCKKLLPIACLVGQRRAARCRA